MKNSIKILYLIFIISFCNAVKAEIVITALQPPVWKESNGVRDALFPGDIVATGDTIFSGKGSRVLLDFNEGSIVELGEETNTLVDAAPETQNSIISSTFSILKGAFRYTAGLLANNQKRDIRINLTTATIGIRGTDLWGRSSDDEDFVVLIEGDITIDHNSNQQVRMNEPQSVFRARTNQPPDALSRIEIPELLELAKETALVPDKATMYKEGAYSVVLASSLDEETAINNRDKFQKMGYPVENSSAKTSGINYTRTLIKGFKTLEQAALFVEQANTDLNVTDAWVLKNDN